MKRNACPFLQIDGMGETITVRAPPVAPAPISLDPTGLVSDHEMRLREPCGVGGRLLRHAGQPATLDREFAIRGNRET
jgi:hypothetical protein